MVCYSRCLPPLFGIMFCFVQQCIPCVFPFSGLWSKFAWHCLRLVRYYYSGCLPLCWGYVLVQHCLGFVKAAILGVCSFLELYFGLFSIVWNKTFRLTSLVHAGAFIATSNISWSSRYMFQIWGKAVFSTCASICHAILNFL